MPVPEPTTGPRGIIDGAGRVGELEDDDVDETLNTFESGMLDLRSTLPVSVHASLVVIVAILFAVLATDILFGDVEIFEETGLTVVAVPEDGDRQGEIIDSGGPNCSDLTSGVR